MPDQQIETPRNDLSREIGSSLASVWARYAGARPSGAKVEYDGRVVRWTLPSGNGELESGLSADVEAAEGDGPALTETGYRRETSAAVSEATHRRVRARISKQDKKTGVATETFILEEVAPKN
jgi:hypothetical protein